MSQAMMHEPPGRHQSRMAAASGWIGSALEYYDFFIYATAASLVFPQMFFPSRQSDRRHRRVARDLRGRLRRAADRRVRARPLGRPPRPQKRAARLPVPDGRLDDGGRAAADLPAGRRVWAPILLVILRLIQGFAVAGEISGASSMILEHAPFGRRGYFASFTLQGVQAGQILAAAVFLPLSYALSKEAFIVLGMARAVPAQRLRAHRRLHHPARGRGDAGLRRGAGASRGPEGAGHGRADQPLARHAAGRLHGADERHSGGRDHFRRGLRGAARLRRRNGQERLSVDPGHRQHRRGDRDSLRRRPFRPDRPPAADHRRLARGWAAVVRLSLRDQHQERAARRSSSRS